MIYRCSMFCLLLGLLCGAATFLGCERATPEPSPVKPAEVRAELERIEDLRLLHRYAIQDLHDARALALYLKGWAGPERYREVEDLFIEAEGLYGALRGVDHGATALQAELDVSSGGPPGRAQLELVQRARAEVVGKVNDFYKRCQALKLSLTEQVKTAAGKKIEWEVISKPEPWQKTPERERGRLEGLRFGWLLREHFFKLPETMADYLLGKGAKCGIAFANIDWPAAGNWGAIEQQPGKYDFSSLDRIIERLAKHHIMVSPMLRTLTGSPPKWHRDKFGAESQFVRHQPERRRRRREEPPGINLFHEPTRQAFEKFAAAYTAHLKQKWAAQVEAVYLEGGQAELAAVADESAGMDKFWKEWSQGDSPWRTPEAILADKEVDQSALVKAEMCREAWLVEYVKRVTAGLQKGWAELRIQAPTSSDNFHRLIAAHTGKSRNAYLLAQLSHNPATETDSPAGYALARNFAKNRGWLWHLRIHAGCGTTGGASAAQAPFYDASRVVIGGPNTSMRAYFPQSWFRYCDGQIGAAGIGSYFLTPRRCLEFGPVIMNTAMPPATVAVLWSQTSLRRDAAQKNHPVYKSAMAWGHMLKRACVHYDFIAEEQLKDGLKNYRVLILPNTQSMTLTSGQIIRDWVQQGGSLMGFGAPGLYDEYGKRRKGLPLADVFGADVARLRVPVAVRPDLLYTGHPEGAYVPGLPPRPYKFQADLTAALRVAKARPRAWFAGVAKEVAITEHTFGQGRAMLCGYPLGFEYWKSCRYEVAYGASHSRSLNYNEEQKRYERWIAAELEKRGIIREVTTPYGRFLRAQLGDDGDWFHIYRNSPTFREYEYEQDRPARTVYTFARQREGIDNIYIGLAHTESNFFWERGYFRSTLAGCELTTSVALRPDADGTPVILDVRLGVPVPVIVRNRRAEFISWLPAAQAAMFAVAPTGKVRLFGPPTLRGEDPETIALRTRGYAQGKGLAEVEILEPEKISAYLESPEAKQILIGCGDRRFLPVAEALAAWLKTKFQIEAKPTMAGPRVTIRKAYMDGFGWGRPGPAPSTPAILIGNCQDNALMWRFISHSGDSYWLPLEINQDFPGLGRAVVMLSAPITTRPDGRPGETGKGQAPQQLVIGASFPAEALRAVEALKRKLVRVQKVTSPRIQE